MSFTPLPTATTTPGDSDTGVVVRLVGGSEVHSLQQEFVANLHGSIHGKTAYIWHVMGSRSRGWSSTSVLGDAAEYLDTSQPRINDVSSGTTYYICSSNANDTAGGTGARTVRIFYLNGSGVPTATTATMNGTTPVSLGSGFTYFLWAEVATVGSNTTAVGDIIIGTNAGAVSTVAQTVEMIAAGGNRSLSGRVKIPTGYTGYIIDWHCSSISSTMDTRLRGDFFQDNGRTRSAGVFHFMDRVFLSSGASSVRDLHYAIIPADAEVKISAFPGGTPAGNKLDCDFDILLISNT
jgi:hypothetical protein